MKRLGNTWQTVISHDNAVTAIIDGTLKKRWQNAVKHLLYDEDAVRGNPNRYHRIDHEKADVYADYLCKILADDTWHPKPPRHVKRFCKNRTAIGGKWREIDIPANLDDHVIAHMLMQANMTAFMRGMYPHCWGSIPGRGTKAILKNVARWLQDDKQCRYFVKLDIRHFFESIEADRLKEILARKIKDKKTVNAFYLLIDSADTACPIGYYTSPWFANLYLEKLDWFIAQDLYKERRGNRINFVRHYGRYVDDMVLIGTSKSDLRKAIKAVQSYLADNYNLELKQTWEIKRIGHHDLIDGKWKMKSGTYWLDIGGYKFCKDSVIMRDGIFLATRRLARKMYKAGYYTEHQCQSINSRLGWASHACSYNFMSREIRPYVNIKETRRIIADVDKDRKQRRCSSG